MAILFEIQTDKVLIRWEGIKTKGSPYFKQLPLGTLRVISRRRDCHPSVKHVDSPEYAYDIETSNMGPPLYEETTYHLALHPLGEGFVELRHRDPTVITSSSRSPRGDLVATVNFRQQVGYSRFEVVIDKVPEFDFEVEVFPTKIDYKSDYDAMVAEISTFYRGLVLEYLRGTFRLGHVVRVPDPSHIEWLTILKQVIDQLERALRHIAQRPRRRLIRKHEYVRADRIRRADSSICRAILRGKGKGIVSNVPGVGVVREVLPELRAGESLDTPEHRWLRSQLVDIRLRISEVLREEKERVRGRYGGSTRSDKVYSELASFESRVTSLLKIEPLSEAVGEPPSNFSSLILQTAPGYREAYAACLILRLGLRIEGGPLQLSLKDINALYEYWCYLAVIKLVAEELGADLDARDFVNVTSRGLQIDVTKSRSKRVLLSGAKGRANKENGFVGGPSNPVTVALTYNPAFDTPTGRHRPDVGLSIKVDGWQAPFEVILDAKYRLDTSFEYIGRHGSPGPPEDAVNVLHRYRDAILVSPSAEVGNLKQTIVVGAALFPLQDPEGVFAEHTFYRSLGQVGIGALPFLPSRQEYVKEWLHHMLSESGWSLSDRVPSHQAATERARWMSEAIQPALIAVIRPGVGQLEWIKERRLYYAPLERLGRRKFAARWIGIYQGKRDRGDEGAITHEAEVVGVDVLPRRNIDTPWPASRPEELQIVYTLSEVRERSQPIVVEGGMRFFRWSSRLSLSRARTGRELLLETEPEWRVYEGLRAKGLDPIPVPGAVTAVNPDDPRGRSKIYTGEWSIRYDGAAGFRMERAGLVTYVATVSEVVAMALK